MGVAIRSAIYQRSCVSLGERLGLPSSSPSRFWTRFASTRRRNGFPEGSESIWRSRSGRQRISVDRRISRSAYARGDHSRRRLLSTEWFDLVLPANLPAG